MVQSTSIFAENITRPPLFRFSLHALTKAVRLADVKSHTRVCAQIRLSLHEEIKFAFIHHKREIVFFLGIYVVFMYFRAEPWFEIRGYMSVLEKTEEDCEDFSPFSANTKMCCLSRKTGKCYSVMKWGTVTILIKLCLFNFCCVAFTCKVG